LSTSAMRGSAFCAAVKVVCMCELLFCHRPLLPLIRPKPLAPSRRAGHLLPIVNDDEEKDNSKRYVHAARIENVGGVEGCFKLLAEALDARLQRLEHIRGCTR
jgi:hypothetical protein